MNLSVYFTPLGVTPNDVSGKTVIVIDVLRTTTTIVSALESGARAVLPAATAEEAARLAQNLERDAVLLAGERGMDRIDSFALGNSPLEMTPEAVQGKTIVLATTNGTGALTTAEAGQVVLVGAVVNFSAVVERAKSLFEEHDEMVILCSGREKMFALEDAYAAGRFAQALIPGRKRRVAGLNDAAIAALELVRRYGDKWKRAIGASAAARALKKGGYKADVAMATEVDTSDLVPEYSERLVTVPNRG